MVNENDGIGRRTGLQRINFDKVARGLIVASVGLGMMELLMPKRVQKMIGVRRGDHTGLIRLLGLREIMSALMIFGQTRPNRGVWSRVVGDAMDLGLLSAAYSTPRSNKDRVTAATAAIAGLTALDVLTATQVSRHRQEAKQYSALTERDLGGRTRHGAFHVFKTITVNASPETLYNYWRNFENLPRFMYHLESVNVIDERRSHWVAKAPAGTKVAWDAEMTEDCPNERIAWRSTENAQVPNSGVVTFTPARSGAGTEVKVEIEYRPPGGGVGKAIATLFGQEPGQQVAGDLRRFKQVIETGEVVRSDAAPLGAGQITMHPARPLKDADLGKELYNTKPQRGPRAMIRRVMERAER